MVISAICHSNRTLTVVLILLTTITTAASAEEYSTVRPNILWIVVEDMSAHFGCYGETAVQTPNVDQLARDGIKFDRAFVTAPVCSTCRSAMITGRYQTSIGAHHHRSGRGELKIHLPQGVRLVPELFQDAGYYTCNGSWEAQKWKPGKTDYNFEWNSEVYNGLDWSGRKLGQPFFAQIHLRGGKLRGGSQAAARTFAERAKQKLGSLTKTEDFTLPPYYPTDPVILEDWARYLDSVRYTDMEVGDILKRLEDEGIAGDTYVFFITDHGISHVRGKQFCYEEGIRIPFLVRGPGIDRGVQRDDLIVHIDMAATSLALAGIPIPRQMEGRDLFADTYRPRDFVVSARDRCDETVDRIRSIRTKRFKYIRNFYPARPYLAPNAYKDHKAIVMAMRQLHSRGKLDKNQSLIMAETRPTEELYDLENDPHELDNLANDRTHQKSLERLCGALDGWIEKTNDQGCQPESTAMFDSDMAVYLDYLMAHMPERVEIVKANIRQMKEWADEDK